MSDKTTVERISPTLVRMECRCRTHGKHVVFLASSDDIVIPLANWLARVRSDEGWTCKLEGPHWEEMPF